MAKLVDQARLAQLAQALDARAKAAVAAEKLRAEGVEAGFETRIQANADAIAAIENKDTGILAQAKAHAEAEDDKLEQAIGTKVDQSVYNAKMTELGNKDAAHDEDILELQGQVGDLIDKVMGEGAEDVTLPGVQKAIDDFKDAQEAIDEAQDGKIAALEAKFTGEQSVDNKIAAAQSAAEAKAAELDGALKTELQGKIDAKVAQADYNAKVEALEGADNDLDGRLDVIEGEGEGSIKKAVADEAAIARAAEKANADAIKAEKERAEGAEGALAGRLDVIEGTGDGSIKKAVADLVNAAPEDMNTLKELSDAIAAHQTVYEGYITTVNGQIATAKSEAIADAKSKDDALKELLQAEIDADVLIETNARKAADTALETKLQAEIDKKVDKVEGKSLVDDTEIARLKDVDNYDDTEVRGLISGIDAAYKAADVTINANIDKKVDKVEGSRLVAETEIAAFEAKAEVSQVNQALQDAKDYADDQDAALKTAIETAQAAIDKAQNDRLTTLEGLVVGGEGEGLEAVVADVAANKAAIAKLNGGVSEAGSVAKAVADAVNPVQGEVDALEGRLDNEGGLVDRLEAVEGFVTGHSHVDMEQGIAANAEAIQANATAIEEETKAGGNRNIAIANAINKLELVANGDNLQIALDGTVIDGSAIAMTEILAKIEVVSEAEITEIINGLDE